MADDDSVSLRRLRNLDEASHVAYLLAKSLREMLRDPDMFTRDGAREALEAWRKAGDHG